MLAAAVHAGADLAAGAAHLLEMIAAHAMRDIAGSCKHRVMTHDPSSHVVDCLMVQFCILGILLLP